MGRTRQLRNDYFATHVVISFSLPFNFCHHLVWCNIDCTPFIRFTMKFSTAKWSFSILHMRNLRFAIAYHIFNSSSSFPRWRCDVGGFSETTIPSKSSIIIYWYDNCRVRRFHRHLQIRIYQRQHDAAVSVRTFLHLCLLFFCYLTLELLKQDIQNLMGIISTIEYSMLEISGCSSFAVETIGS